MPALRHRRTKAIDPLTLPDDWTAIATRPRNTAPGADLVRSHLPGAPLGLREARQLAAKGILLMVRRHKPDRVELVVRPRRKIDA